MKYYITDFEQATEQLAVINKNALPLFSDGFTKVLTELIELPTGMYAIPIIDSNNGMYLSCYKGEQLEKARELNNDELIIEKF